jgi:hypothetical protein
MGKPANDEFDPKAFLAKVGAGKTGGVISHRPDDKWA